MIIVGELINASRKEVEPAVVGRDSKTICSLAKKQVDAGAHYIEVNAGTLLNDEDKALEWLTLTVQSDLDLPLALDSANPVVLEAALKVHRGKALINSITAEEERFENVIGLVKRYKCSVVALCLDDKGIPKTPEKRVKIASNLIERLLSAGIPMEDIYIDPLVQPISTDTTAAIAVLKTIQVIKESYVGVRTICGLSNISFGLPRRRLLNQAFLMLAMDRGLDAVIMDPLDKVMMSYLKAAEALLNMDRFCMRYLSAARAGNLVNN